MKILFVSSEVVPFAKTGGLADVAGALPLAVAHEKHDVRVVMPLYRSIDRGQFGLRPILQEIDVHFPLPLGTRRGYVQRATFPGTRVPIYFVQQDEYFARTQLYGENGSDYTDNAERFAFFSMATLWMLKGLDWRPDIIHCCDWQTALIPTYLRNHEVLSKDPFYSDIRTLFTIHNLAYQCQVPPRWIEWLGLPWNIFTPEGVEFYGQFNLMKAGILHADHVSTVSPRYAQEVQTEEYGAGLHGVLQERSANITGILNGIDTTVWDPENDANLPAKFSINRLEGKAACKTELQRRMGLPEERRTPILAMISRLIDAKGYDLVLEALPELLKLKVQLVVLGMGDSKYEEAFRQAAKTHPSRIAVEIGFEPRLAHMIEAGADMFLMPSRYEPCGLNQLYSLKYGTIPIVRRTGGLSDTIHDATPASIKAGTGTGFLFDEYNSRKMLEAIRKAIKLYTDDLISPDRKYWIKLQQNAMSKDFSWTASAREYVRLYQRVVEKR